MLDHFRVSGRAGTDLFVGRVDRRAAAVSARDRADASQCTEHGLRTPETAAAQRGEFDSCSVVIHVCSRFSWIESATLRAAIRSGRPRASRHSHRLPLRPVAVSAPAWRSAHLAKPLVCRVDDLGRFSATTNSASTSGSCSSQLQAFVRPQHAGCRGQRIGIGAIAGQDRDAAAMR